jgi:hypothetical protein
MTDGSHLNKAEWCRKHDFPFGFCSCSWEERPRFEDRLYRGDPVAMATQEVCRSSPSDKLSRAIYDLVRASRSQPAEGKRMRCPHNAPVEEFCEGCVPDEYAS